MSSAHTPLKSHIDGINMINILCIQRFAKNCTCENKDTTFDHKFAKFDTREKFRLYGSMCTKFDRPSWNGSVCIVFTMFNNNVLHVTLTFDP